MVDKIKEDLKQAQLAQDVIKVSTLRLLLSEIHNGEIQKGGSLNDQDVISVVQREIKKRKEAAVGFRSGGRETQAQKEEAELKILESYLPLTKIVEGTINEVGAND